MKKSFSLIETAMRGCICHRHSLLSVKVFLAVATILIVAVQSAVAGGTIKGKVLDKEVKEALPGANILVKGTSIGAATNLDGEYVIPNVPAGEHTIEVTYIGYKSTRIRVTVPEDGTVEQNFRMEAVAVQGEAVVVTAQGLGQAQAINQQLASDKIANIVSETRIQELPDFNAAQAISRLPGVSTLQNAGEANKVVVRGLAPQYNAVEVEGIQLASTGSAQIGPAALENTNETSSGNGTVTNDRSVDLSMVTPYMIKSIAVYKSLTPDMNANAIGGTVNMELREAPSDLHYDLLWQSGYTAKSSKYGNYRAIASGSRRFFNDRLGAYLLINAEKYDRNADNMDAQYDTRSTEISDNGFPPVTVRNVQLNRHLETRNRYGGNLIMDYRLPSGSIKSINMLTRLKSDYADHKMRLNYSGAGSGNIDFSYREGINTIDLTVNSLDLDYDFGFFSMDMKAAYTTAENNLPDSPLLSFNQTGGIDINEVTQNTVPEDLKQFVNFYGDTTAVLRSISLFGTTYREQNRAFKTNFKLPFNYKSAYTGYLKIGGEYRRSNHTNDQETPYVQLNRGNTSGSISYQMMEELQDRFGIQYNDNGLFPASIFTSNNQDLYNAFLQDKFGQFYYGADATVPWQIINFLKDNSTYAGRNNPTEGSGGWFDGPYQQLANDYRYDENYYAGYLMTELRLYDFMAVGGVRYEKVTSEYSAYNARDQRDPAHQPIYSITVKPENEFWLPMGQIKFQPVSWGDVRYSYTQTLARPDYHQLTPKYTITQSNWIYAGNPNLKPAQAYNHDLIFSFHSNKLGLFSIGGFYKIIKDFTYSTIYELNDATKAAGLDSIGRFQQPSPNPDAVVTLSTYINSPYKATVKGFEVDFQTNLWYMPFPFNRVIAGINYTRIKSETKYPWIDQYSIPNPDWPPGPRRLTVVLDSTRNGRLIHQPNDILNSYIGFDFGGFSARLSFIFQGNSVSKIGRFSQQDGFTKDYFRMDFSARQKLPYRGSEVFVDITNLNDENNLSAQRSIDGFTNIQNYGLTANLGIRFKL